MFLPEPSILWFLYFYREWRKKFIDEAVEDTDDFWDGDAEDVTEDDDNLGDVDNVVKDDSLGDGKASEDEGIGEGESVEDTEDLDDEDAEDVTEDKDKLDDEDVNVTAVSTYGHSDILLPLSLLFLQPLNMYQVLVYQQSSSLRN